MKTLLSTIRKEYVRSGRASATVVYDILREIQRVASRNKKAKTIFVNSNPEVADLMYSDELKTVEKLEKRLSKRLIIRAMGHYHIQKYEVYSK